MAPKKKAIKSGDKASKSSKKEEDKKLEEPLSELSKEMYRLQIKDLEERLERYQHKCDELEVREKEFSSKLKDLDKDRKDIVSFLKRTLAQTTDKLANVKDQLLGVEQAKEMEKDSYETQLAQLRHEFQGTKDQLVSENMVLAGKLASLEEFQVQKENLMAQLASMEEQLERQKQEHQTVVYNLEMKAVLDNDRLKKEMQVRVTDVAAEFRQVSDKQMAETTKRMIRENMSLTAQLGKLSDKSLELLGENEALREQEVHNQQELWVLEHGQKELARKNIGTKKVVLMLTEKCKQLQAELEECNQSQSEHLQLQANHAVLQHDLETLRQELGAVKGDWERERAEAEWLSRELAGERGIRAQLESVLLEAARTLKDALTEMPGKQSNSEAAVLARRSQMMQKLLALLNTAALLGIGPTLQEFLKDADDSHEHSTGSGPERPGILSPLLKGPKLPPHYRLGDLGLVPRPAQTLGPALSKVGPLSKTTQLSLHKPAPVQVAPDSKCRKAGNQAS
ncbi:cilia- and flagella-associated protein 157 isoform X2 [Amia ocellicauda]|uniref:cilia- and flagella-associated protein 157 isoform X2 n=1 Tax=Amia ocellicauda TaxID=2972642 RepID=UPI0034645A41